MSILPPLNLGTPEELHETMSQWHPVLSQLVNIIHVGKGTPEGNEVGSVGHIFLRSDGGAGTTIYVKQSGANTKTGWVAK